MSLHFTPVSAADRRAVAEYERIWYQDGPRIVQTLEAATGLAFREHDITVNVGEAPSNSGFGDRPMQMRSSYPEATKRATLIHELGHRLHAHLFARSEEDHPWLFLYLYDVWVDLYGPDFAAEQVAVESRRRGPSDYAAAWQDALALTVEQRQAKWWAFMRSRGGR